MNLIRGETNSTNYVEEVEETCVANINSKYMQSFPIADYIPELIDSVLFVIDAVMDKYVENGSSFKWIKTISLDIFFSRFVAGLGSGKKTASVKFQGLTELKGGK